MLTSTIYAIEHNTLLLVGGVLVFVLLALAFYAGQVSASQTFTGIDDYWLSEALTVAAAILALASALAGAAGIIHQLL